MKITQKWEKHVAVFAFPFASHPAALLSLVKRLASVAPTIVFSFFNTKTSNRVLFSELSSNNILPYDVSDGIPKDHVFSENPEVGVSLFLTVAEEELKSSVHVAEMDTGLKVSCLVVDAFMWFSGDIAEEMRVPWVALWVAGASSLYAHLHTDLLREKSVELIDSAEPKQEIFNLIPGLEAVQLGDIPSGVVLGNLESPVAIMLHKMGRTLPRATVVVINSFEELEPDLTKSLSSKLNNFLNIGPSNLISDERNILKCDEYSCISWLDNQKTRAVAYICFGTICKPSPSELFELAEALEETKTPFLWSLKKDSYSHFPKGFLERITASGTGKVVPWAPQDQVLNHRAIGVLVSNGGWNSVLEGIGAGVRMICRPCIGDNHLNSWMVERVWGIGLRIHGDNFTKHATCCAFEHAFSSSKLQDEKIQALKDLAHKAVAPNGSSDKNFKTLVKVVIGAT